MTEGKITQESIDEHLASTGKSWTDHGVTLEGIRLAEQVAKNYRLREYGEQPVSFRTAAEVMDTWSDEPANNQPAGP